MRRIRRLKRESGGSGDEPRAGVSGERAEAPVRGYFDRWARYWSDVYGEEDQLAGLIYGERMQAALSWIDDLGLPPGSRVLEVGCGAGLATVELCRRGFEVEANDLSEEMVALAARRVADAGLGELAVVRLADVHELPDESGSYTLVVALGVLPWLHSPDRALAELARVLAPDGHLVATVDNRKRLARVLDPSENPLVAPLVETRRSARRRRGWEPFAPDPRRDLPAEFDRQLVAAGLVPQRRTTLGYGPFTFRGRPLLPDRVGIRLHTRLHALAGERIPRLRRYGWDYLFSARRVP
jgi:SAM-dependent methyltransferase